MTFPNDKFADVAAYCDAYFNETAKAAACVDRAKVARAAEVLADNYGREATLFVCGNGGSAAIANSFVCDHEKLIQTDTTINPRVVSLAANIPMMTAIANDISYDDVFLYQLKSQARFGDALLTISASGDSENVVRAGLWARENRMEVISLTGFDGGRTAELATVHLHVAADNYGVVEDIHQGLMHLLAQFIRQSHMTAGLIAGRRF